MFLWLGLRAIVCFLLVSRTLRQGSGVSFALELGGLRVLGFSGVLFVWVWLRVGRPGRFGASWGGGPDLTPEIVAFTCENRGGSEHPFLKAFGLKDIKNEKLS